ncbi:hypothetical protein [Methylobacterium sp. 22177]|uniref:hypothetical protein n=1 Tax=Methylobacterium sp. 22177 TaxID=3453885 RepID=UPI003F8517E1
MSTKVKIPAWAPHGVASLYEVFGLDNIYSQRLISDKRMKDVWKQLKASTKNADTVIPSWYHRYNKASAEIRKDNEPLKHLFSFELPEDVRDKILSIDECCIPNTYDQGYRDLTVFDYLSAALFFSVTAEMINPGRSYPSKVWAETQAKPYSEAAELCRFSIDNDPYIRLNFELIDALKIVETYFQDGAVMRRMESNPRVVPRGLGRISDEKRGHYDLVSSIVESLFGPFTAEFPKSAVARIVAVTLNTDDDSKEKVKALGKRRKRRKTSRDLPAQPAD